MEITYNDNHVYINGIDVTSEVLAALKHIDADEVGVWRPGRAFRVTVNGVYWEEFEHLAAVGAEVNKLRSIGVEDIVVEQRYERVQVEWRKVEA